MVFGREIDDLRWKQSPVAMPLPMTPTQFTVLIRVCALDCRMSPTSTFMCNNFLKKILPASSLIAQPLHAMVAGASTCSERDLDILAKNFFNVVAYSVLI